MAGTRPDGLHKYSVQEAANQTAHRRVIRVYPTLAAAAISGDAGDVLFNGTEIPNAVLAPGGCAILANAYVVDYDDLLASDDFIILFHQVNEADWGTPDATANISAANIKLNKFLGFKFWDNSAGPDTDAHIDNAHIVQLEGASQSTQQPMPLYLQAEEDSTSVYFSAIQAVTSSATPDWDTGDLEFIFHIDY